MVVFGRGVGTAGNPVEEVRVGAFKQRLVAIELAFVKAGEMGIGKPAEDQIALASAAMP